MIHDYQVIQCELDPVCSDKFAKNNPGTLFFAPKINQEDTDTKIDFESDLLLSFELCRNKSFCAIDPETELRG